MKTQATSKSMNNSCAKYVTGMIKSGDGIKSIEAYCQGFGVNTNDFLSPVYIREDGSVCVTIRGISKYYYGVHPRYGI